MRVKHQQIAAPIIMETGKVSTHAYVIWVANDHLTPLARRDAPTPKTAGPTTCETATGPPSNDAPVIVIAEAS